MSNEQPQFYYILSQIDGANWVLTATQDGQRLHLTRHGGDPLDDDLQIWQILPDSRSPEVCYIVNPFLEKVIRRNPNIPSWGNAVTVELAPLSVVASDPEVLWYRPAANTFTLIHSPRFWTPFPRGEVWNWNINVAGDGPYNETSTIIGYSAFIDTDGFEEWGSANNMWQCIPDTTKLTPTSIDYDLKKATIDLNVPPTDCQASVIDTSRSPIPVTQTLKLTRTISSTKTTSYSEANQHSLQIANTFGVKLIFGKIAEVTNSTTVTISNSSTVTIGDQQSETSTVTDEVDQTVTVPIGKVVKLFVRVNNGKVTVPYVAHIERTLPVPGIPPRKYDIYGEFTNVNATDYSIVVEDVASQNQVTSRKGVSLHMQPGHIHIPTTL